MSIPHNAEQTVVLSCHLYDRAYQRWQGFRNMGLVPPLWRETPSLSFAKMLGSGAGEGFSVWPHWGRYLSLTVWDSREAAEAYLSPKSQHLALQRLRKHQSSEWSLLLKPYKAHGAWDQQHPFKVESSRPKPKTSAPIVVLTRARIRARKLLSFWRGVPQVSQEMRHINGNLLAIGVGELPLIQQATISIWENEEAMRAFAYASSAHRDVIKRTRELGWYSEELFARFTLLEQRGELTGGPLL